LAAEGVAAEALVVVATRLVGVALVVAGSAAADGEAWGE